LDRQHRFRSTPISQQRLHGLSSNHALFSWFYAACDAPKQKPLMTAATSTPPLSPLSFSSSRRSLLHSLGLDRLVFRALGLFCTALLIGAAGLVSAQELWSDPATWPDGLLPVEGDLVTIPAGRHIVLDMDPPQLGGLRVRGTLSFAETPLHLQTDWIMIMGGTLRIGTESAPHMNPARITLTGEDEDVLAMDMGGKLIGVMFYGTLDLHGARKDDLSWTQLDGSVLPGDTVLQLVDVPTWRVGDEIVLAPSGVDATQAENLTVTGVQGRFVTVQPPLAFPHHGETETHKGKLLDMRAEVGLLTRNIVIEGDASSDTTRFGGHVMIMNTADAFVEGVEFRRMGQTGRQGRYPLHWHLTGDQYDNYARYNSVHHSFHRAMVIHGTNGVTLEGNVAYDITSHGYVVAEDGNEEDNVVRNNLGVLIRKIPRQEDFAFPDDGIVGGSSQAEHRPGVFWMKNPNQYFEGNHAAGSMDGIGFFFDGAGTATSVAPDFFKDNLSHSNWSYFEPESFERYPPRTRGHGLFIRTDVVPGHELHFQDFTAYKNQLSGIWMEEVGQRASNLVLAENGTGAILMRADIADAAFVDGTANTISPPDELFGAVNTLTGFGKKKEHRLEDVFFSGFDQPIMQYEDSIIGPGTAFAQVGIAAEGSSPRVLFSEPLVRGAIVDEDGSLQGMGPSLIFHEDYAFAQHPMCSHDDAANTRTCPIDAYAFISIRSEAGAAAGIGPVRADRLGGGNAHFFSFETNPEHTRYQYLPFNSRYRITPLNPPNGILPSLYHIDVESQQAGYVALRIPVADGWSRYVLDENDMLLPRVESLATLSFTEDNYYMDTLGQALYLVLRTDAASAFKKSVALYRVPAQAYVREAALATASVQPSLGKGLFTWRFEASQAGSVRLRLYDAMGRLQDRGFAESFGEGLQHRSLDLSDMAAGQYHWVLEAPDGNRHGRLVISP
jgi:cell migration-inducing and hyaluronan-binding protein